MVTWSRRSHSTVDAERSHVAVETLKLTRHLGGSNSNHPRAYPLRRIEKSRGTRLSARAVKRDGRTGHSNRKTDAERVFVLSHGGLGPNKPCL